ncbi:aminoglycoside phosphotransferase family protein [Devosia sp. 1635]|uniref:aminoglycoside phosphotransferase family protein n=1 Tax=Devosia sp. 1635 TaxID=2726066 RepID=UPI0015664831|nr:aminoglycoside phosphotransferase family protein [Devosia sp. 1635]
MTPHPDEISIDDEFVCGLLRAQAPQWANLPVRRIASSGTDNAIFRLGDNLAIRLPRRPSAAALLSKELDWLPHLQGLPLEVPVLQFRGWSERGFDFGIFNWMEGEVASPTRVSVWQKAATSLADFLQALHLKDTNGAPPAGERNSRRGIVLGELTEAIRPAIDIVADEIAARRAHALWDEACTAEFLGQPVWLHGDLKADNLIVRDGVLRGVIDWGLSAVGDPAADYATAWFWVDPLARDVFRNRLSLDKSDWLRSQGWALYGAVIALSYYRGGKNEALCRQSRLTLSRLGLLV